MSEAPHPFPETDHGIAGWPGTAEPCDRPARLPDGRPWPRLCILIVSDGADAGLAATLASVDGQGYPELNHVVVSAGGAGPETVGAALADPGIGYLLWLRAGDLLAPGGLAALCLEAELTGAGAVAGLRVLFDLSVHGLDILAPGPATAGLSGESAHPLSPRVGLADSHNDAFAPRVTLPLKRGRVPAERAGEGQRDGSGCGTRRDLSGQGFPLSRPSLTRGPPSPAEGGGDLRPARKLLRSSPDSPAATGTDDDAPFTGGEILLARETVIRAGLLDAGSPSPAADLMRRLDRAGVRVAWIGRPVLLRHDPGGARGTKRVGLSIVSLTDLGYRGGAGIAHRRLAEALELAGHRVRHVRLADESPPAAAEWTDRFPRTEAAILSGKHNLVLAGNLHGVTRGGGLVERLARNVPTGIVLHDLFALTGRCAHPKACPVIAEGCDARCPSPTEYPQLAPERIAGAYAGKRAALSGPSAPLLLANSAWTEERARALAPAGAGLARIRLAFPTGVFRPRDRAALRRRLGLPLDDVLILFSAVIADAPDKGFADLAATMTRVARPGVGFVAVGRLDDPGVFGIGLHAPGPIGDEEILAQWYAACDIYLTASRLETLGQTPIEAGLCGVPTVAYRATGLTSAVLDGVTGLLAEPREGALAQALEVLIADADRRRRLGAFARIVLENRFSHASAALSLHEALAAWNADAFGLAPRLRFAPEMLGRFAFARERHPGAAGLVAAPSRPITRILRRAKQAMVGRGMPLWMRRALYAAALLRRMASRRIRR